MSKRTKEEQKAIDQAHGILIWKFVFGIFLFPFAYIKLFIETTKTILGFGLLLHERKEFKNNDGRYANIPKGTWTNPEYIDKPQIKNRYSDIPKGMSWTNPEFLSEEEKLEQEALINRKKHKRFF